MGMTREQFESTFPETIRTIEWEPIWNP
jgi:hypothetical protein